MYTPAASGTSWNGRSSEQVSADLVLPRDQSSTFPSSLPVANISFDSSFVHLCQYLYMLPFHLPWFVKAFQAEAQYQPVALPSEPVHPCAYSSSSGRSRGRKAYGALKHISVTLEPCLVFCAFSFPVGKCRHLGQQSYPAPALV